MAAAATAVATLAACGGSGDDQSSTTTTTAPTVTTVASNDAYPFDATSATYFPGVSLEGRLKRAQQVCASIHTNGDNFVLWLTMTKTRSDLVPFTLTPEKMALFAGLAVKSVCPKYLKQLQDALGGAGG